MIPRHAVPGGRLRIPGIAPPAPQRRLPSIALIIVLVSLCGQSAEAQSQPFAKRLSTSVEATATFPLGYEGFGIGVTGQARFDVALSSLFKGGLRFQFDELSQVGSGQLQSIQGGLGLGMTIALGERFFFALDGTGGLGLFLHTDSAKNSSQSPLLSLAAGLDFGLRLSPSMDLLLGGGFRSLMPLSFVSGLSILDPLLVSAEAGLSARYRFGSSATAAARFPSSPKAAEWTVSLDAASLRPVFPVFYSYYDSSPFGEVVVRNGEDSSIRDVKVWFSASQYMNQPKLCASIASIAPGASVKVPLYALFSEDILDSTENGTIEAEARAEYRFVGAAREAVLPLSVTLFHRNAMNWTDDRRAAAFASPKDPAVLWFSRFVSGIVSDRGRPGISKNLQLAMGLFEAERLYGLNYVVDPSSSYVDNAADESAVDYLQYPHQTLAFRGGDCDDLSILFCSLLESIGIEAAFVTIPGHIYAAFALEAGEEEAKREFYDPQLLVYAGGKAWVPVEITMIKDGFVKAWRVGAKEWYDNRGAGDSRLFPLREAWKLYPSAGLRNVASRFALPDEASTMQAFDSAVDRYVVREIDAEIRGIARDPTKAQSPEVENRLGLAYGRNGMLKEAWTHFSASAKGGYSRAWANLAGVAFLRRDWALAAKYYDYAESLDAKDDIALLGSARSYYELERFDISDADYLRLSARNPVLAAKFGYLGSKLGGEGRAWSLADRLASMEWSDPARRDLRVAVEPKDTVLPAGEKPVAPAAPAAVSPNVPAPASPGPPAPVKPASEGRIVFGPSVALAQSPKPEENVQPARPSEPAPADAAVATAEAAPAKESSGDAAAGGTDTGRTDTTTVARADVPETAVAGNDIAIPADMASGVVKDEPVEGPTVAAEPPAPPPPPEGHAVADTVLIDTNLSGAGPDDAGKPEAGLLSETALPADKAGQVFPAATDPGHEKPDALVATEPEPPTIADAPEDRDIQAAATTAARTAAAMKPSETIAGTEPVARQEAFVVPPPVTITAKPEPAPASPEKASDQAASPPLLALESPKDSVDRADVSAVPPQEDPILVAAATISPNATPTATAPALDVRPAEEPGSGEPPVLEVAALSEVAATQAAPADAMPAEATPTAAPLVEAAPVDARPVEVPTQGAAVAVASTPAGTGPADNATTPDRPESVALVGPAPASAPDNSFVTADVVESANAGASSEVVTDTSELPADSRPQIARSEVTPAVVPPQMEEPQTQLPAAEAETARGDGTSLTTEEGAQALSLEREKDVSPLSGNDGLKPLDEALALAPEESVSATVPSDAAKANEAPVALPSTEAAPAERAGVPEQSLSGAAAGESASMQGSLVAEGFSPFRMEQGTWSGDEKRLVQLSDQEYFAKAVMDLGQGDVPMRFSFEARSLGQGWVGYGIHVGVQGVKTHKGYGEGRSWLVWITSDPVHLGDSNARIQLYRSLDDINMARMGESTLDADLFSAHLFEVEVDPSAGSIVAFMDGRQVLRAEGLEGLSGGECVALRALDRTEFRSFRAEETE